MMEAVDGDTELLKQKGDKLQKDLPKIARAISTLIAQNSGVIINALGQKPAGHYGQKLGKGVNAMASIINQINEKQPSAIPDFMAGAFESVDKDEFGKMTDSLPQAFLDQKPPLLKWTAATMFRRAKRLVLKK